MASNNIETGSRYRMKCPGPLSLSTSHRYSPYGKIHSASPLSKLTYQVQSRGRYVPTPPCPNPATWSNTFSYDSYSIDTWASDLYQHARNSVQLQSVLLQREYLLQDELRRQGETSTLLPASSSRLPRGLAAQLLTEEADVGFLGPSHVSRVSPDGDDICDDVLNFSLPDAEVELEKPSLSAEADCTVPSSDSPVVYSGPDPDTIPVSNVVLSESALPTTFLGFNSLPITCFLPHQTFSNSVDPSFNASSNGKKKLSGHYPCKFCPKSFKWRSGLATHMRTHTGERPYQCPHCPKSFGDFSTYTKHCRVHTGLRPYACDYCQKTFTQSGNKLRHLRTVHKDILL